MTKSRQYRQAYDRIRTHQFMMDVRLDKGAVLWYR